MRPVKTQTRDVTRGSLKAQISTYLRLVFWVGWLVKPSFLDSISFYIGSSPRNRDMTDVRKKYPNNPTPTISAVLRCFCRCFVALLSMVNS